MARSYGPVEWSASLVKAVVFEKEENNHRKVDKAMVEGWKARLPSAIQASVDDMKQLLDP